MKHSIKATVHLLVWCALASAFIVFSSGKFALESSEVPSMNPIYFLVLLAIFFGLGTLFWLKFAGNKKLLHIVFALGMGMILGRLVAHLVSAEVWWLRYAVALPVLLFYAYVLDQIYNGNIQKWYVVNNLFIIVATVFVGSLFASFTPNIWIALVVFVLFAVYDAWAVWKTKHMQTLAKAFISNGVLPGLVYPYKRRGSNKLAMLGGGDIFFMAFIANAMYLYVGFNHALLSIVGMFLAVVYLFVVSEKGKFYPALPYLFGGMLIGLFSLFLAGLFV